MTPDSYPSLLALLAQEEAIYHEMAGLLEEEGAALTAMAPERVAELVARKETLALRIKALDESRRVLARRLATALGLAPDQVTITLLAELAEPTTGRQLAAAGAALRAVVERCRRLNEENGRAARLGMELVSDTARWLVAQADPAGQVWRPGRKGGGYGAPATGSSLITRQA